MILFEPRTRLSLTNVCYVKLRALIAELSETPESTMHTFN